MRLWMPQEKCICWQGDESPRLAATHWHLLVARWLGIGRLRLGEKLIAHGLHPAGSK